MIAESIEEHDAAVGARRSVARRVAAAGLLVGLLAVYWPTFDSLAVRWTESGPYEHGWLVLACLAWLVARRPISFDELPGPIPWALLALIALSAMWSVALLANITVVQHALLFAVIAAAVFGLLGQSATRRLVWALLLLGTAMPAWDAATPILLPIAVWGASAGIAILGIPGVIEASTIEIPAGVFEVAEGCAGLRYVLSALALAVLAGEIVGATTRGRLVLIAVAGTVAVVSNWLRIVIVIAVGDATEMRHPLVADHLWLGLVLFALLVIPSLLFATKHVPRDAADPVVLCSSRFPTMTLGGLALLAAAALALPAAARIVEATRYRAVSTRIELPTGSAGWLGPTATDCPWSPQFAGADAQACAMYESTVDGPVFVSAVAYLRQTRGRELIRGDETAPGGRWRSLDTEIVGTPLLDIPLARAQTLASPGGTQWQMWYWYQLGSTTTPSALQMKLAEALALPPAPPATLVAIATPCRRDCSGADGVLARYLDSHPALARVAKQQTRRENE